MKQLIKTSFSLVFLLLLFTGSVFGQLNNHMILRKGPKSVKSFMTGDSILFFKHDQKFLNREMIQGIGKDYIVVRNMSLPVSDITGIVHIRAMHYKSAGNTLKIAGPTLIFLDGFNSLVRGFEPLFSKGVLIVGTAIFGAGFILPTLQSRRYYMRKGYNLIIVPSDPETYRSIK